MGRSSKEYFTESERLLSNDPHYQEMCDQHDRDWWKQQDDELQQQDSQPDHDGVAG